MTDFMDRISINPKILAGKPAIKGTRIAVELILKMMSGGMSEAEILEEYPDLVKEDIRAALRYAFECLSSEDVIIV
jgi:uncharacterized protein (DUF433 family)